MGSFENASSLYPNKVGTNQFSETSASRLPTRTLPFSAVSSCGLKSRSSRFGVRGLPTDTERWASGVP